MERKLRPIRYGDVGQGGRFQDTEKENVETERPVYNAQAVRFTTEEQQIFDYLGKQTAPVQNARVIMSCLVIIQGGRKTFC